MFDLKTMYLCKDFMKANQYGVSFYWLLLLIILFAVVLHYTVTLQYSAFFHVYFKISQQYERKLRENPALKPEPALKGWLRGLL